MEIWLLSRNPEIQRAAAYSAPELKTRRPHVCVVVSHYAIVSTSNFCILVCLREACPQQSLRVHMYKVNTVYSYLINHMSVYLTNGITSFYLRYYIYIKYVLCYFH